MSDLYLIRHAQASFGGANYDQLSDLGRRQARIVGEFLRQAGVRFNAVYSGSLERQTETARILISSFPPGRAPLEVKALHGLNEYDSGKVIQGHMQDLVQEDPSMSDDLMKVFSDRRSLQRVLEKAMSRWVQGDRELPGLETYKAFTDRVRNALDTIMREAGRGSRVAVVTSGGPLSIAMQMALGLPAQEALQLAWQIRNASVSTFKFNASRITLSSFNSTAHLEIQGDPSLLTYR